MTSTQARVKLNGGHSFRSTSDRWNGMSKQERINTVQELLTRMNITQAAQELGVSTGTIHNWRLAPDGRRMFDVARLKALQAPGKSSVGPATPTVVDPSLLTKQWADMNRNERVSIALHLVDTEHLPYAHAARRIGISRKTFSNFYLKHKGASPTPTIKAKGADDHLDRIHMEIVAIKTIMQYDPTCAVYIPGRNLLLSYIDWANAEAVRTGIVERRK